MPGRYDWTMQAEPFTSRPDGGAGAVTRYRVGGYAEYAPPASLEACCEALWIHRTPDEAPAAGVTAHRVLPDLGVSLAFQGFRDRRGVPHDWSPIIAGPKRRAQAFDLVPGRELAAVRIKPEWVGPLLGIDPLAIEDSVIELAEVCRPLAEHLCDALQRTRSAGAALQVLVATTEQARESARTPPSALATAALELVRGTSGRLPCERLAASLGLSDRHFRRQVHDAMGLPPKAYARAVRFVQAMLIADRATAPDWADVAVRTGYCDQSHLIRECVTLTGIPPRQLHTERRSQNGGDTKASARRT